MKQDLFTRLKLKSQRGFSHHLILPVVAIFAVAGIGAYLTFNTKAAIDCPPGTTKTVQEWNGKKVDACEGPRYKGIATAYDCGFGKYPYKKEGENYLCKWAPKLYCNWDQYAMWNRYGDVAGDYGYVCFKKSDVDGKNPTYKNPHDKAYGCKNPRPVLRQGSTGNCVRYLQYAMNHYSQEHGSPKLKTDGVFGSITEQAVKSFQSRFKKDVDGIVGPDTWGGVDYLLGKYPDEHARSFGCTWVDSFTLPQINKVGMEHPCVKYLQWALAKDGFPVLPSGTFNEATQEAVKKFEKKHGLTVNGGVGRDTWPTVMKVAAKYIGL